MASQRYLNIVFQGGGVRGIAYAGVLKKKPKNCVIHSVGGTSAGALVAALLAIGKGDQLDDILRDRTLYELIQASEQERLEGLREVARDLSSIATGKSKKPSLFRLLKFLATHRHILKDLSDIWRDRGLHHSDNLRDWLNKILEGKDFEKIDGHVEDLRIVAADVSSQEYRIYSRAKNPTTQIALAVHASVSIPIFFTPLEIDGTNLVDGGLLSNFPSFLFSQSKYPTLGLRLGDIAAPRLIESTVSYLQALLLTMTEAHDKQREKPPFFTSYKIPTPASIASTNFALTEEHVTALFNAGLRVGQEVDWEGCSSDRPIINFFDPKPQETLQQSLQQANQLLRRYSAPDFWVEELENEGRWLVRIDQDWSTTYDSTYKVTVKGQRQLFISKFIGSGLTGAQSGPLSLFDCKFIAEEVEEVGGVLKKKEDLILIPAFNRETEKGYVQVFSPPIAEGKTRHFRTGFRINQEFSRTLARGADDIVSFSIQQAAHVHRLKYQFVIEVAHELPQLEVQANFGRFEYAGLFEDTENNRNYRRFVCRGIEAQVSNEIQYEATLSLAARAAAGKTS